MASPQETEEFPKMKSMMRIAVHDAATNCARDGATAYVTLRSGKTYRGVIQKPTSPYQDTIHITTEHGWATVDADEVAGIEAYRNDNRPSYPSR